MTPVGYLVMQHDDGTYDLVSMPFSSVRASLSGTRGRLGPRLNLSDEGWTQAINGFLALIDLDELAAQEAAIAGLGVEAGVARVAAVQCSASAYRQSTITWLQPSERKSTA